MSKRKKQFSELESKTYWQKEITGVVFPVIDAGISLKIRAREVSSKKNLILKRWKLLSDQILLFLLKNAQRNFTLPIRLSYQKEWKGICGWKMSPTRFVPRQSATAWKLSYLINDLLGDLGKIFHLPYSPDFDLSDHRLLRGLQNYMDDLGLISRE